VKTRAQGPFAVSGEDLVYQYFKCIESKDLDGILELFDYDATVKEPFSNVPGGLRGRSSIEPFLKVAMMANSKLQRRIKLEKPAPGNTDSNKVVAIVTFEKGDKVKGRFNFEFENTPEGGKKIKSLKIEFL